jgi:hypothetical protein
VWSATGREIFYVAPTSQLMAAQVSADGNFFVSELRSLFDASALTFDGFHQSYAVTADGPANRLTAQPPNRLGAGPIGAAARVG